MNVLWISALWLSPRNFYLNQLESEQNQSLDIVAKACTPGPGVYFSVFSPAKNWNYMHGSLIKEYSD